MLTKHMISLSIYSPFMESKTDLGINSALSLTGCRHLYKICNLPVPSFPYLKNLGKWYLVLLRIQ